MKIILEKCEISLAIAWDLCYNNYTSIFAHTLYAMFAGRFSAGGDAIESYECAAEKRSYSEMNIFELIIGIVLLVMAVFLVVVILMQSGKDKSLSGTIAGGAETFFGKSKASTMDKMLSKVTTIVAIVFAVLVLVMYMIQGL